MLGFVILLGVLGVVVGSFVNVVAIRVPIGHSLNGRSHCPACSHVLGAADLVPIASWMALRGHCRHCRAPVSSSYAVVEAACGAVFVLLAVHFGPHAVLAPYLLLASGLIALSVVDFRTFRLPNRIVGPLTVAVVAAFAIVAVVDSDGATFVRGLEAGLAATAGLGLLHLAYPAGLGFGDVKLAFVLGVATGWASWGALGLAIFLAAALGATVGVIGALAAGEPVRGRQLPFGPFLAAGALLAAVIGPSFLDWYTQLHR